MTAAGEEPYLEDFWAQVVRLHEAGIGAEEAAARIDMRGQAVNYPTIRSAGVNLDAVLGAYEVLRGER
jgi:hypothetical protein